MGLVNPDVSSCFASVLKVRSTALALKRYVCWPLTFIYLEWLSKKPSLVGDSFVVKMLMNGMGYSATKLKSSHSMALLTFSLAGFGRLTGYMDPAVPSCTSRLFYG